MNIDRLLKEHPAFTFESSVNLDDLPPSFFDDSWHNDAGPMFSSTELGLRVFIDYPPELSDFGGEFFRYALMAINEDGEHLHDIFLTDHWDELLNCIAEHLEVTK